jgi:hypothetical protein
LARDSSHLLHRAAAAIFTAMSRFSSAQLFAAIPTPATPNHALQRTAPARHTGCSRPPRFARPRPPFRTGCAALRSR